MSEILQVTMRRPEGVLLKTQGKFCDRDIAVNPELEELNVTQSGEYTPKGVGYSKVTVDMDVETPNIQPLTVTENGTYTPPSGVHGYSPVSVNVPSEAPKIEPLTITQNGTYNAPNGVDGYSPITVNVPSGGSSGGGSLVKSRGVNFYDYDGTLLHSYTVAEAQALTELPPLPAQKGLICQGWNYDLATIKSYNRDVDVGATYITDDGKTRLYINIAAEGRMTVPLRVQASGANRVTIDWGDGSEADVVGSTSNVIMSHTYASTGEYVISIEVADGYTLTLGTKSTSNNLFGSVSGRAFAYPSMLQKVEIGNGVPNIDAYVFQKCYSLSTITIPNSVTSIGSQAFSTCYSLSSVVIPHSVTNVDANTFQYCYSLSKIVVPESVTQLVDNLFVGCYSLSSVVIPNSIQKIGQQAFQDCYALSGIVIPESVTTIGNNAFQGCYTLDNVVIPNSVTSLGTNVFCYCYGLSSIVIPSSVKTVKTTLFQQCYSLSSIILPEGITGVNEKAFYQCQSLASVVMPSSITSIGTQAFYYCGSLNFIDFSSHTTVPSLSGTTAFSNTASDFKIRVPAALYDEWIAATNWSSLTSKIVAV